MRLTLIKLRYIISGIQVKSTSPPIQADNVKPFNKKSLYPQEAFLAPLISRVIPAAISTVNN